MSTADPVGDQAAVLMRLLLPRGVAGVESMDRCGGGGRLVLAVRPRQEVIVATRHDLGRRGDRGQLRQTFRCQATPRPDSLAVVDGREEEKAVTEVARRLCERYPTVPAEEIRKLVDDYHREFDGRPIRNFVPVLVEREAREYMAWTIPTQR